MKSMNDLKPNYKMYLSKVQKNSYIFIPIIIFYLVNIFFIKKYIKTKSNTSQREEESKEKKNKKKQK